MSNTFFIADLHLGHKNVIGFDKRPYFTVTEMNKALVNRWNNKVAAKDTVYVIGDFFWDADTAKEYLSQLKGRIILIEGNHDKRWQSLHGMVYKKLPYLTEKIDGVWVYLSHHYTPFYLKQYNKGIHIYGHSHNTQECKDEWEVQKLLKSKGYHQECYNVGCMHLGYEPKTIGELRALVYRRLL